MGLYTWALRPALFSLDPERAHDMTMAAIRQPLVVNALRLLPRATPGGSLRQEVAGLAFAHPLGLAAGLDKQGTAVPAWAALGLGFAEIGTVTPRPQPGNPRPRLFRLPSDRALINRYGFNSEGASAVAAHLAAVTPAPLPIGINIGKNRLTPNERAAEDYTRAVEILHPFADYFVVNVSSPNTSGLRDLQESRMLRALVERVVGHAGRLTTRKSLPVLVKVSPDLGEDALLETVDAAVEGGASGIVAINTTIARSALRSHAPLSEQTGGLSGAPLRGAADDACRRLFRHLGSRVPIIGVGGIFTAEDAYRRIRAGASLVQVYTGLIYEGPALIPRIVRGLAERLARDGFSTVREAIGIDAH
jgi:dihydroorotate dehydrogenase